MVVVGWWWICSYRQLVVNAPLENLYGILTTSHPRLHRTISWLLPPQPLARSVAFAIFPIIPTDLSSWMLLGKANMSGVGPHKRPGEGNRITAPLASRRTHRRS